MQEIQSDLFLFHRPGNFIGITTNGTVKKNGENIMGGGVALLAAIKFPELPKIVGNHITKYGNDVFFIPHLKLFMFPTKHTIEVDSSLDIIERSCQQLKTLMDNTKSLNRIFMPRPGVGLGNLSWDIVKPVMVKYFQPDDRLIIVDLVK